MKLLKEYPNPNNIVYKIYGIYDTKTEELIYIGRTTQTLEKRFLQHKSRPNLEFMRYVKGDWSAIEIRMLHLCRFDYTEYISTELMLIKKHRPCCNIMSVMPTTYYRNF